MFSAFMQDINNSLVVLQKWEQYVLWLSPMCSELLVFMYQKGFQGQILVSYPLISTSLQEL